MYTIPSAKLAAVALAASNEKGRDYLHGVFIEATPSHVTMTATNGHILLTARHDAETPDVVSFSIIIPSDIITLALRSKTPEVALSADDAGYKLGNISFQPIDGVYPDWRRVVPKASPETLSIDGVWFPTDYLTVMAKAAKLLDPASRSRFIVYPDGESPALVQFLDDANVVGVVMPIRTLREPFSPPAFTRNY